MEANQLPPKGAINFIYCGPPCQVFLSTLYQCLCALLVVAYTFLVVNRSTWQPQGFTGMNRFPKADDVLNSLIATTLSCVDFYRPTYFLLGTSMDLG
jgi:hypothetical protein